jgi:hypothetical protein
MEENGAGKDGESQRKKREEIERNDLGWKKTERGEPTGSPYPGDSSFRSPLTFTMAAFNVLVQWHGLRPSASGFVPLSIAEFSL